MTTAMKQYSAKYFSKTSQIIKKSLPNNKVTLQFFQRKDNVVLCGINETLEMLKSNTDISKYEIKYLEEGTLVSDKQVVLQLEGPYWEFGEFEGIIDGILARLSSIATNARNIVKAAKGKKVVFMGDRADHFINQSRDGYAVAIGGIKTQVTDAHVLLHDGTAVGTMPHALIQSFGGDLNAALRAYKKTYPGEKLTALVDFNNDVISDSLKALREFGEELTAVRVDTSESVSDAMFLNDEEYGVTSNMIKTLRKNLDAAGGKHVKIIVSSGFDTKKIKSFEDANTPVDVYGVGASILQINLGFTADAVRVNGQNIAKVGRAYVEMKDFKIYRG